MRYSKLFPYHVDIAEKDRAVSSKERNSDHYIGKYSGYLRLYADLISKASDYYYRNFYIHKEETYRRYSIISCEDNDHRNYKSARDTIKERIDFIMNNILLRDDSLFICLAYGLEEDDYDSRVSCNRIPEYIPNLKAHNLNYYGGITMAYSSSDDMEYQKEKKLCILGEYINIIKYGIRYYNLLMKEDSLNMELYDTFNHFELFKDIHDYSKDYKKLDIKTTKLKRAEIALLYKANICTIGEFIDCIRETHLKDLCKDKKYKNINRSHFLIFVIDLIEFDNYINDIYTEYRKGGDFECFRTA